MRAVWLGRVSWELANAQQQAAASAVAAGGNEYSRLILCELDPIVTTGRRSAPLTRDDVPVVHTTRGGLATYHGPGQLIIYPVMCVKRNLTAYLAGIGECLAAYCRGRGVDAAWQRAPMGVWSADVKLAACGINYSRRIVTHGFSFNVSTPVAAWHGIDPCGLGEVDLRPLAQLCARPLTVRDVAASLAAPICAHMVAFV